MDKLNFLERLDELIGEGQKLANNSLPVAEIDPLDQDMDFYVKCHRWCLSSMNLLRTQFGVNHVFYTNFKKAIGRWQKIISKDIKQPIDYCRQNLTKAYAVLLYVRREFKLGLVADAKHLYEAELFSNILEQGFELAEKGYLVAAAVYCRLIIENFINDLCRVKGVKLEENDKLPQKLTKLRKKDVIDLPTERSIQAAYDIGTYAVHGKDEFKKYNTKEKIIDLLENTRDKILTIL